MAPNPDLAAPPRHFEEHAREVIARFRHAIGELVDDLPVDPTAGPTQMGREIKVDTKLAWKISHLLEHPDLFDAGRYIPGMAAVRRFLQAAARHHPPKEKIQAVKTACEEFEAMVKLHAGDRRSFDMMLAGRTEEERHRAEMEHRKEAYQSLSFLWGLQARAQIKTAILAPSATPERVDAVVINGFIDLRRIRTHVPWRITSTYSVDDHGNVRLDLGREPLDREVSNGSAITAPLMPRFCSKPLPQLQPIARQDGAVDFALVQGDLGRAAAQTCLIGERVIAAEPRRREPGFDYSAIFFRMRTPCETALLDVLVHRDLFGEVEYTPRLYSDLFSGQLFTEHLGCDELSLDEKVQRLGAGIEGAHTPAMPRYREMLRYAFERVGWNAEEFDLHRISLEYPITPTDLVLRHPLPERPA